MDPFGVVILLVLLSVPIFFIGRMIWRNKHVQEAESWPSTEATVHSGDMEVVASGKGGDITLPCFAFSYVVAGEYYSGRFSLLPNLGPDHSLIQRMNGRTFAVHYDPKKPSTFFIPGETMEGCDIQQRLSDRLVTLDPKDC